MSNNAVCIESKGIYACVPEYPDLDPPNEDSKMLNRKKNEPPIDHIGGLKDGNIKLPINDLRAHEVLYSEGGQDKFSLMTETTIRLGSGLWRLERNDDEVDDLRLNDNGPQPLEPGIFIPLMGDDGWSPGRGERSGRSDKSGKEEGGREYGYGKEVQKTKEPLPGEKCGPAGGGGSGCY